MTGARRLFLAACGLTLGLVLIPSGIKGQQGPPYTLEQVEGYLAVGLSPELILSRVQRDCLAFRVQGEAETRLRAAGAQDAFLEALRGVCYRGPGAEAEAPRTGPASATAPRFNPTSAAVRSLIVPGLGQFSTGRPAMGAVFLVGAAGVLGLGLMSSEETVQCLDRVTDTCPPNRVASSSTTKPMLAVGVGGWLAVAVVSALEARSGATKANARAVALGEGGALGKVLVEVLPAAPLRLGRELVVLQLRF